MTPIPQSLYDRAELLARAHPLQVVAELIGKRPSTVTIMKQRQWKARDYSSKLRRRPPDFAIQAEHLSHRELIVHYQAGGATVTKWLRQIGKGRKRRAA